jgi:hypothetical protein
MNTYHVEDNVTGARVSKDFTGAVQGGRLVLDDPEDKQPTAQRQNDAPRQYLVEWSIDAFDCASPREAAEKARAAQVRPGTIATIFDVTDTMTGEKTRVDLTEQSKLSSVKYDGTTFYLDEQDHDALCSSNITGEDRCNCTTGTGIPLNSEGDKLSPVSPRHAAAVKLATSIETRRAQIERFRRQTSHDYTQGYLDALDDVAIDMGLIPPGRPDRT